KEENKTADILERVLRDKGLAPNRFHNNVWAVGKNFDLNKPTLLLNSHHDTVKPNAGYTIDPFYPLEKEGKLFGLGSNDAGGSLVSLLFVFLHYQSAELPFNLLFAASAEEEISGKKGIETLLPKLPKV